MLRSISSEDRISALPDPIIHHILSFLPTKLSAATTILSKRWKPLWLSVPALHFDDETFPNYDSFHHFVSFVFLLRDITLHIRSFHLKCSKASTHHLQDVNRFVYAAAQRGGIENLNLEISIMLVFKVKLPLDIFSCRTLVVLQLSGLKVNDLSHVVVDFPLLKTLHLYYLLFKRFEDFVKLLSGCPILEKLQIDWVYGAESLGLVENSQSLPNLIKAKVSCFSSTAVSVLFALLCKAKVLCVELDIGYNHFPMFQNLIRMELIIKHNRCEKWEWVIEVLKRCPKLQNLTIDENYRIGKEVVDNWMDPTVVPECLSTQLRTCLLKGYKGTECQVQFAKYIMQNAKVLNTISIKSVSPIDINVKYLMISKLASSSRASSRCDLLFD